jgi:hypothetical protein
MIRRGLWRDFAQHQRAAGIYQLARAASGAGESASDDKLAIGARTTSTIAYGYALAADHADGELWQRVQTPVRDLYSRVPRIPGSNPSRLAMPSLRASRAAR